MLPESLQKYLEKCSKSDKGKVLKVIAQLTQESSFDYAIETVDHALKYDATDADSLISLHNRIHKNIVELPPIRLAGNIPKLRCATPNLAAYDRSLAKAGAQNVN